MNKAWQYCLIICGTVLVWGMAGVAIIGALQYHFQGHITHGLVKVLVLEAILFLVCCALYNQEVRHG